MSLYLVMIAIRPAYLVAFRRGDSMRTLKLLGLAITVTSISLIAGGAGSAQAATTPSVVSGDTLKSRISAAMLAGRCEEAKEMAIKAGDFDLAEQVVRLCSSNITVVNKLNKNLIDSSIEMNSAKELFNRKQYIEAYKIYMRLSESGNSEATNQIGLMLQSGLGVQKDTRKAISYFKNAAERGELLANYNLGFSHFNGIGVEKSYKEAFRWFTYAAERDHGESQNYLGLMYANGYGVRKDVPTAIQWYRRAASNGSIWGNRNISELIEMGLANDADLVIPKSGNHEPNWKRAPTKDQVATFYPKTAVLNRVTGKVLVGCEIGADGQVGNCEVLSEDPPGYGFGSAAVRLARISEFTPKIVDGKAVKGVVRVPFNFDLPPSIFDRLIKALNSEK